MPLTDEEKEIFQHAMEGVTPYHQKKRTSYYTEPVVNEKKKKVNSVKMALPDQIELKKYYAAFNKKPSITHTVTPNEVIAYAATGFQHRKMALLKKGHVQIDATLDLHEHNSDQAFLAVNHFIETAQNNGLKALCIIHGKSAKSDNEGPILKNLLNRLLRQHEAVLAFHSSKYNTGSVVVVLKTKRG